MKSKIHLPKEYCNPFIGCVLTWCGRHQQEQYIHKPSNPYTNICRNCERSHSAAVNRAVEQLPTTRRNGATND